jgi:hypothetical protein
MFRTALLCKPPLFATPFANRAINERSEAIFDSTSDEQMTICVIHCLYMRSQADIKQTFTYSPHPAVPDELEGYAGSQVGGTGTYRMVVDAQGKVNQVTILKGFTVTAVYDERFSDVKGNAVPALDQVMVQALMRWRARPGSMRVVDIYWSFGTHPWVNYGKSNATQ